MSVEEERTQVLKELVAELRSLRKLHEQQSAESRERFNTQMQEWRDEKEQRRTAQLSTIMVAFTAAMLANIAGIWFCLRFVLPGF